MRKILFFHEKVRVFFSSHCQCACGEYSMKEGFMSIFTKILNNDYRGAMANGVEKKLLCD